MEDPKLPKQLNEESPLVEFTTTGNVYIDPAFTGSTMPATSPITGEALSEGNTLTNLTKNSNNSPDYGKSVADQHTIFVSNLDRGTSRGNGHDWFFNYKRFNNDSNLALGDIYIVNGKGGDFSASPRASNKHYTADSDGTLNIYIEGSTFGGNLMGFGSQNPSSATSQSFTGNYEFTFKNSVTQWFAIGYGTGYGLGERNNNNNRFGTIKGNIDLLVDGSTATGNSAVLRGGLLPGAGEEKAYLRALFNNSNYRAEFGIIMTGCDSTQNNNGSGGFNYKSVADLDITITGSTMNAFMMLPNASPSSAATDGSNALEGNIAFKTDKTTYTGLVIGAGRTGDNTDGRGWVKGDISFSITGSTNTGVTSINKGNLGTSEKASVVDGTIENSVLVGAVIGFQTGGSNSVYADTTLRVIGSTTGAFSILSSYTTASVAGTANLEIAGSTMGNVATDSRGDTHENATFALAFTASEKQTNVGAVSGEWNTITVDAGAKVFASSISMRGETSTLNIAVGSALTTADLKNIGTINVTGELPTGDTIIVSGLSISELEDGTKVMVGDTEFSYGLFGGQYSITTKGEMVLHNGDTYLVNSNYPDGAVTTLGPKGYSTFKKAQNAITDPTKTSITVYGLDPDNLGNSLNEDITTKNFTVVFVSDETNAIDFNDHNLLIGDSAAVDSVSINISYTDNINAVTFGNITNKAAVTFEATEIKTLNLKNATVGDAQLTFMDVEIEDFYLADQAGFVGTITVSDSTITNVYGAASGLTVDMTGGNTITNVYAEYTGSAIQLGTSEVNKFVAGYSTAKSIATFEYEGGVNATEMILGGDAEKNTIGTMKATLTEGEVGTLRIGGNNDVITGNVDLAFEGGDFDAVAFGEIGGNLNATISGGHFGEFDIQNVAGKATVTLAGGTVAMPAGSTAFIGLVYGASISGALNGGNTGTDLIVDGNAKVDSIRGFTALNVSGGTLNVAGGDKKSEVTDGNTIEIDGDITNRRGINAGAITAQNLTNYGLIGVLRQNASDPGITLSGNLVNASYIKTSALTIGGNFTNTGKITSVGDITVQGTFTNDGEIYFRSAFSDTGVFSQEGGLALNNADLVNNGFISAATLTGVKNLTTSKMYITGGAAIEGNLTILAGAEVAFTNKANEGLDNGLELGGTITMSDTSALIVSGELSTTGTATITVNCGDLIGMNELIRAEGGINAWTIKLAGASAGNYELVQDDISVLIYSTDEVFVSADFEADEDNFFEGNKLLYGKNAFATVAEAVAGAKAGAKIHVIGDLEGSDISAAAFDVILDGATNIGSLTAKTITVIDDSDVKTIVSASKLTIEADSLLTVAETIPTDLPIVIDGSQGTGSRLVLDVDSKFTTLKDSQVTVISASGKAYTARILAGEGDHAGDLYIVSQDNVFYRKDMTGDKPATFVDGESFDAATGDALFNDVNIFGDRAQAEAVATTSKGTVYLVGFYGSEIRSDETVPTAYEFASNGDSIYGSTGSAYGTPEAASAADHTTILSGTRTAATIYGLNKYVNMTGDYTFIAEDTIQTANNLYIMGNTHSNVMNGNITAEIMGSTFQNIYLGCGSFGTDEKKPIDIDITIRDSTFNGFYGIHTQRDNNDPANRQDINANFTVRIYDSFINGGTVTFLNTNNDNYSGDGVTQLQTYYTAGSITLELGGVNMPEGNIRIGSSLEVCGKATQAFNVPITVHVVATENSTVTHCDWVCDVDTLIVDATAQLLIDNALQYTTVDKGADNAIDNGGTLTQVMINMSGYKSGTHNVIQANYNPTWGGTRGIYTDNALSNITVIGDNDLTGQCELAYLTQTNADGDTYLNAVYVFDKTDDMFVNPTYTDAINGTSDSVTGQEYLLNYNAHTDFDRAFFYANEWGGTITVTGGEWGDIDFQSNDAMIRKGASFDSITMAGTEGAWTDADLTVENGAQIGVIDGSKDYVNSTLNVVDDTDFAVVKDFTTIDVSDDVTATFESLSGSNLSLTASSMIIADELDLTGNTITIDVTDYVGLSHVIISSFDDIAGYDASNVTIEGENKDKFSVVRVDNDIVLKTTIASDTFLNSTYTEATTGTILPDGTYLEFGQNAFNDAAAALAGLGSRNNTLTITGGEIASDLVMNGANFALTGGALDGIVYATYEKDYRNMTVTVGDGSVGGIEMTAQEGSFRVTRASIVLADGATVTGSVVGAGDTTVTVTGEAFIAQTLENIKSLVIDANACISASSIEMVEGGTIKVTGIPAIAGTNMHKVISTSGGYSVAATADAGIYLFEQGNDLYVLDLGRIYYSSDYTAEITGTTLASGDVLFYGINAFSDLNTARATTYANKGMLYVQNRNSNLSINGSTVVSVAIQDSTIGTLELGPTGGQSYTGDVHVVIENSVVGNNNSYIMGQGSWNSRNTLNGTFTLDVTGSTLRGGRMRIGTFYNAGNKTYVLNFTDTQIRGDMSILEDSPFNASDSITVNMTNVTAPVTKWWTFFDGYPNENDGTIEVNLKDSVLGDASNGFRFALQRGNGTSNQFNGTKVTFNVDNTTVNGSLQIEKMEGQNITFNGHATLNATGDNKIRYILKFNEVNLDSSASITGSTLSLRDGGMINIDATGYEGPTKSFIYMTNAFEGVDEVNVIGLDESVYELVVTENAVIAFDGTIGNLYWNPNYTIANSGWTSSLGDVLIVRGSIEEQPDVRNAYSTEDAEGDISGLDVAKLALQEGYKLIVTGVGEDGKFFGTLDCEEVTEGDINVVILDGNFTVEGSIVAAADVVNEKVATGGSTIEIAGGTFGKAATETDPAIFAEIDGTRYAIDEQRGSKLLVTYDAGAMYANITDFDSMTIAGNVQVMGNIEVVNALYIDCNGSLSVAGNLDATSVENILLSSGDYTGPSKVVLHSDSLTPEAVAQINITVDGSAEDRWYYDGKSDIWLVSNDPSNVYLDASFTDAITGTTTSRGDLLYYGINAVNTMEEAVAKTTSEYALIVSGGVFAGDYSLASIGGSSVFVDGGTIGSLTLGSGDVNTRVELTGATAKSYIGTIYGDANGARVILDKDAKVGTINNANYVRIGLDQATGISEVNYITGGGQFVLDLSQFNAREGNVLAIAGGLNNFIVPVAGETYSLTTIGVTNSTGDYGFYYDPTTNNVVSVKMNGNYFINPNASAELNGTTVGANTLVYGFNVSRDTSVVSNAKNGSTLYVEDLLSEQLRTDTNTNAVITQSYLTDVRLGPTSGTNRRTGDFTLDVIGSTMGGGNQYLAGRGSDGDNRATFIVGTQESADAPIVDGVWNLTFRALKDEEGQIIAKSSHVNNGGDYQFKVTENVNIAGGIVNLVFEDYALNGDMFLFDNAYDVTVDGTKQSLKEMNVTMTNVTCPAAKWIWFWDPREDNATTINLTITDSFFTGDTMGFGLFGTDTSNWTGEATVTISGVTVGGGTFSGGKGANGNDEGVNGTRTLLVSGDNSFNVLKQFTNIDLAAGATLNANQIIMAGGTAFPEAGFIVRGEAGYTGEAKEFIVATGGISGVAQTAAQFLDAEGQAIEGYVAVVGATNVFIYTPNVGAIYYGSTFTEAINGTQIEDALTGKKNFLVLGDNAVTTMADAYTQADAHNEKIIVIESASDNALYAKDYTLVVNGGFIDTLYGSAEDAAVAGVDVTLNQGVTVKNVVVATEGATVSGNALITVGEGANVGTLDGAQEYVTGASKLVFEGDATAFSIANFDDVTIQANSEVTLTSTFTGTSLTIDVTGFTGASKRVMTVNGGDIPAGLVINAGGYGAEWLDGKTLVLVSATVTDVYVDTAWTEADVAGKFVGDMLLVWNKNAFNNIEGGALAVGKDSTLFVSGNVQSTADLAFSNSSVVLNGSTVGLGAVTASGTALTVAGMQFTATSLSGISELSVNADAVAISGGIAMSGEGKLTVDVSGHTQTSSDAVVLTTETGITGLDKDITVTGTDAEHYYAYYNAEDGDIHLLRIDNLYVDVAFGTAGEGIKEGDTNPITHERLVFGANAFYSIDDAMARFADGMGLYVNSFAGDLDAGDKISNLYLSNSEVPVLINGYTNGDTTYTGDVNVNIIDSAIGAGANSTLVAKTRVDSPWDHLNTVVGNVNVKISGSTLGSATENRTINGSDYLRVTNGNFTFNVSDSTVYSDLEVIGDSPIAGTEVVNVTFKNVVAPVDRNWWVTDGNQNNAGTINITLDNVNLGAGDMQVASQSDWNYGDRNSSNKVTFNVSNTTIGGSLSADCIGREELTGYSGAKVLNVTGDNTIGQVLWFKNINIDASATLTADAISMSSASAKVTVDATAFTGKSRVIVSAKDGIANLKDTDVALVVAEESPFELFTDYNAQTKTMTSIVIKGTLKDIYANEDYTVEELPIGTTYNGEALFYGFNAFDSAADALAALTVDGDFYVTGSLSYESPDGQVITINNNLINDGSFKISAKGFVDGSQSEAKVLTATAITGKGVFSTDNAAYTATVRDNSVYLVLKKVDVFVNTAWAELEDGSVVEIPGGTAILGTDAFATADLAASKVSSNGTITVLASDVKFSSAIVRTVTATTGSTIQNANIGSASGAGSLTLESGATATNAQVRAGSTLTVSDGAKVTSSLKISEGAVVSFGANTALDLDISASTTESAAVMTGYSIMTGSPAISITIAADQADGTYAIATDAASFGTTAVTLKTVAATITTTLTVGNTETIEGIEYTLALTDNNDLTLTKHVYEEPITVTYVNPAWSELAEGAVVMVTGGTAIVGKDAFADADLATEKVISTGIVKVVAGTVTFANGITKQTEIQSGAELTNTNVSSVLTVNAGATLSGKAVFGEGANVTVNGTVVFDLALSTESAQFTGFAVTGDAKYKLVGESATGDYTLATGVTAFTSLTVGDQTLAVGSSIIVGNAFEYTLSLNEEGTLALNIATYTPPVVIPTVTYVDSSWVTKTAGAVIPVEGGTAIYKTDAFATGDEAIAAVSADGEVKVLGGTVSFTDAIAKTVTISADATLFGKATFGTAITIDGTVAFDTALTADGAQITGLSKVTGATKYTLTAAATAGTYTLATDAAGFNSDVAFNGNVLKVGDEAITIGDFTYQLAITDNSELALTIAAKPVPPTPTTYVAKSDIDGNGISDVMFVWTGNNYQHGYWMNGTSEWQSVGVGHPADWDNLGCYDMTGDGKADSVLFGNVTTEAGIKGAYIGYYADANDADANWVTIGYLTNEDDIVWKNAVGNLTGNEKGTNSIVWYAPELYALGAWTDGTETWAQISGTFGGADWTLVGCGDFDGDGKDSIVMSGLNGQYLYWANVDGTTGSLGNSNWAGWEVRAIGDFSGDAKDDIVLFHSEYGSMVMLADGNLDDFKSIGQLDAADWFVVGAGDYNNDQKDDLLVRQYSTGMLGYYVSGDTNQWVELGRGVDMNWTVIA